MTKIFSNGNAALNSFVMECLELQAEDRVLEVGFGPGRLINEMANRTTKGIVEGIDFSETMLKHAEKMNRKHISSGRVILHKGECGSLPFANAVFDKVCSINTLYFWDNPIEYFAEMFRVIRSGGSIAIGFRDCEQMSSLHLSDDIFSSFSREDVLNLLSRAGFRDAHIEERDATPFDSYCGVAKKA